IRFLNSFTLRQLNGIDVRRSHRRIFEINHDAKLIRVHSKSLISPLKFVFSSGPSVTGRSAEAGPQQADEYVIFPNLSVNHGLRFCANSGDTCAFPIRPIAGRFPAWLPTE